MKDNDLRRDPLDYLLTDTMPVELSELFTYTYFYEYLHKNRKYLDGILQDIKEKEVNVFKGVVPFSGGWLSSPLTYNIVKPDGKSYREMSVPQPMGALNMYFFIHLYQRDILNLLENPVFSVRYHSRNNDLVYKNKSKRALIDYQYSRKRNKKVIEQTGRFFDIRPFIEAKEVGESEKWRNANVNFKLFCKLDFKRCFPSVYTHSFKWIITRDIVDSKSFKNPSLFAVIDRILQNINGSSSNGVLVGPEFSRMIVEVLLQQIDKDVAASLLSKGLKQGVHYEIMRFVDDFFVFTNDEDTRDLIEKMVEHSARQYLLEINQLKIETQRTPYFKGTWLDDTELYKDRLKQYIRTNKEIKKTEGEKHQITCTVSDIQRLKGHYERLLSNNKENVSTITSYMMSVILNSMSDKTSKDYTFFKKDISAKTIAAFLEYIFYIYSHSISFKNTQKLIAILNYCHEEINLQGFEPLQSIIHKYEKLLRGKASYSDYINLVTASGELDVHFSLEMEQHIFEDIKKADDPIALATFWSYAKYNPRYMKRVSEEINLMLGEKLRSIRDMGSILQYKEFWYVIIFNKCPYISKGLQYRYDGLIRNMLNSKGESSSQKTIRLIAGFMLDPNEPKSFISWNVYGAKMLQEITFRTHRKTIFRKGNSSIVASL